MNKQEIFITCPELLRKRIKALLYLTTKPIIPVKQYLYGYDNEYFIDFSFVMLYNKNIKY